MRVSIIVTKADASG